MKINQETTDSKLLSLTQLEKTVSTLKEEKKTIALCHGVFDLLHPGHISHFEQASELADILIISLTSDRFVNKGPGRPLFTDKVRAHSLCNITHIDYVFISDSPTAIEVLKIVKPDFYVKGSDYINENDDVTGMISKEKEIVESFGSKIYFTSGFTSSSSKLINSFYSNLSDNCQEWLRNFKEIDGYSKVVEYIAKISRLRPLILGECIIDKYTFCTSLAKSSKDPILAFQTIETNTFAGGVLAIANNCSSWSDRAGVITFAAGNTYNTFSLGEKLNKNIELEIIPTSDRPTILKHRYVELGSNVRLFEYYDFSDSFLQLPELSKLENSIFSKFKDYDLLILADYGHGYFSNSVISLIEKLPIFTCINTQSNAGNRGYNTISKYSRANVITFNGAELQLELRNRNPDYLKIVPEIMQKKMASHSIVTLGADGLIVFEEGGNFEKIPAFATKLIDKVGAGDSVFAIASLLAKVGAPLKVIGFLSNLVAAHEVSQLGHGKSLSLQDLVKQTKALLG